MPMIEGFRVQNFRALKDITIGKLWHQQNKPKLTPFIVVIGKNGAGKSTLFDAFGFLADCLAVGVEEACNVNKRGGFKRIRSTGQEGPMRFEISYREAPNERPITYELAIDIDSIGRPFVMEERLRQRRKGQRTGRPYSFLYLESGVGEAWAGEESYEGEDSVRVPIELTDQRNLGIVTLGSLKEHPRISRFKNYLRSWYLSYFTPDAARSLPLAGPQKHLNLHGDNISNVVQYMERDHPVKFQAILDRIAAKIPGIQTISTKRTDDDRLLLRFNDRGFEDPFFAQQMSDGTLKLFAYMILLEDPDPPPFICIEEPENGLYHKVLGSLAQEFRTHASGRKGAPQIFVTTHQPYFVDACRPEEVWILEKGGDGFASVKRAIDIPMIKALVNEGLPLGGLWYSDYMDAR